MSKYGRCNECGGTNGNHFSDCCYDGTSESGYDSWVVADIGLLERFT